MIVILNGYSDSLSERFLNAQIVKIVSLFGQVSNI
ncbi:hypothetical protein XBI1_3020001 [Xenorhabdus bovienii str. Intermedium]|uniref:Uncharacterized protein n=1 Tax=Xenorhabdus bovienii str. Intermedium TaxID=1379677 RepID=A0A077QLZ6_XENBV|nr:hypothetical protein XBI1_3020001 [Xenorhabdus bovienii str. Intermedium]